MIRALSILAVVAALAVSAAPASASQSEMANHTQGTVSVMFLHGDFSS